MSGSFSVRMTPGVDCSAPFGLPGELLGAQAGPEKRFGFGHGAAQGARSLDGPGRRHPLSLPSPCRDRGLRAFVVEAHFAPAGGFVDPAGADGDLQEEVHGAAQ